MTLQTYRPEILILFGSLTLGMSTTIVSFQPSITLVPWVAAIADHTKIGCQGVMCIVISSHICIPFYIGYESWTVSILMANLRTVLPGRLCGLCLSFSLYVSVYENLKIQVEDLSPSNLWLEMLPTLGATRGSQMTTQNSKCAGQTDVKHKWQQATN